MRRLKAAGVTPKDLLVRVVEFVAHMDGHPDTFRKQREEDFALARALVRMVRCPKGSKRPQGHMLAALGELTRMNLYPFALSLIKRLHEDGERRDALRRASLNFEAMDSTVPR
jgi:hypothetical protein